MAGVPRMPGLRAEKDVWTPAGPARGAAPGAPAYFAVRVPVMTVGWTVQTKP